MGKFKEMVINQSELAYVADEPIINTYKSEVVVLQSMYVDKNKEYIYCTDSTGTIRKMKIDPKDKTEARIVFAKAKGLIGKPVVFLTRDTVDRFGNIRRWKNTNWFCDIIEAE